MMSTAPGDPAEVPAHVLAPQEWQSLPPEVYVPIASSEARDGQVQIELREIGASGQALPVYSSPAELFSAFGSDQPWMSIRSSGIPHLAELTGVGTVLADVAMPETAIEEIAAQGTGAAGDPVMLFAPSRRFEPGDETAWLELQPVVGDKLALVVFSSEELLHAGCGPSQLWVSFRAEQLPDVLRSTGADMVFKDRALPEQVRWGRPGEQRSFGLTETGHDQLTSESRHENGIKHTRSAGNGA